jgi:dTMP kinase
MKKGLFIVLDSGEGGGKGTQIKLLEKKLGKAAIITREPGGSPYAEEIRKIIKESPNAKQANSETLFGLFWASRADHLKNTIIPALRKRKIVLSDRFDAATYAYQIVGEQNKRLEQLFWLMRKLIVGKYVPDLYIYLDIKPEIGLARKTAQGPGEIAHFEERELAFHRRMRRGYTQFFKCVPHAIINADQPVELVERDIAEALKKHLGLYF